jgi:hypothetical protein
MKKILTNSFTDAERAMFAQMRVCIVSPIVYIEPQWTRSTVNAVAYAWSQGLRVEDMGIIERTVVHWARNELVRAALELRSVHDDQPFTHFMWLDSDHVFDRDLICQLARHYARPEVDMISALYFNRNEPFFPVVYVKDGGPSIYTHYPLIQVPNCLCEVDAVGFGAIMTKREVFEKMTDPWFHMTGKDGSHIGEDMSFCVHAKEAGFRLFLDGQYKLGHFSDKKIVTERMYNDYVDAHPGFFGDKIKVKLGGIIEDEQKTK